jgi:hypothetical protein
MQIWGLSKTALRFMALVGVMAGMFTIVGCGGGEDETQVAATNTTVPINSNTVKAIDGQTFTLPAGAFSGVAALASQSTSVRFTNTSAATPTATITAANGTATGNTTFGSCIFTITTSTIPGVTVGQQITVNPCQYNVQTQGVQATGQATTVNILLQLGIVPSAANQASVSIDPTTGVVTVNNVSTGVAVTLVVSTGSTGG